MFSVHTTLEELKNAPITGHLRYVVRKPRSEISYDFRDTNIFELLLFQNVFSPHENEKRAFSNSSGLNSVFENLGFRDGRISVDVRLNRRNEASFSNFSGVLWTGAIALIVFQRFSDKCRR